MDADDAGQSNAAEIAVHLSENTDERQCWICFGTSLEDPSIPWVHPCKCRGTTQWVHRSCLQRWIDEKQRGDVLAKVSCERCQIDYILIYPQPDLLARVLENCEANYSKLCPALVGLFLSGTVAWCAITHGALVVFICAGYGPGMQILEKTDPLLLLLTLPIVPVVLVSFSALKWSSEIVGLLARLTLDNQDGVLQQRINVQRQRRPKISMLVCEALALPVIARFVGDWLFSDHVTSQLSRTFLGGAVFVTCRHVAFVYLRYRQLARQSKRSIIDFTENSAN